MFYYLCSCSFTLTFLLQLQKHALSSIDVGHAAVDVHSWSVVVSPLAFLPQLDHGSGCVSICVCVEVVPAVCFIDGDVQVRQVKLNDGFGVSCGYADALNSLPHHRTL